MSIIDTIRTNVSKVFQLSDKPIEAIQDITASASSMTKEFGFNGEQLIKSFENEEIRQDNLKIEDYRRMVDNDGQVQMLWNAITTSILSAGITLEDDPDYDNETKSEQYDFVYKNLFSPESKGGLTRSMALTNRTFLRAFIEGYRIFEIVYRLNADGKMELDKLSPKAASNDRQLRIIVDNRGGFVGYHERLSFNNVWYDIKVKNSETFKKVLKVTYGEEFGSLYGRSGLRAAWYHYDKVHKSMFLVHVGLELGVIKPRLLKITGPLTDEQKTELLTAFDRVHMESTLMYPAASVEVEFADSTDASVMAEGREIIDRHYSLMAKSLLAQFIDLGSSSSSTGSRALGESQVEFFMQGLQSLAEVLIEDPWNEVISNLVKVNFGDKIIPRLKVNPISKSKSVALITMLTDMSKNGALPDLAKNKIIAKSAEDLNLDISEDEIEVEMEQKKQEDQQNMQQEHDNALELQKTKVLNTKMANNMTKGKPTKLSDHTHRINLGDGTEPILQEVMRPLFTDEQKVKIVDIKRKLDDAKVQTESILATKLLEQRDLIVNKMISAMRSGRKAIKNVDIQLAEGSQTYRESLHEVAHDLFEFGKRTASNEINKALPTVSKKNIGAIDDQVDITVDEQEARLRLRLQSVANNALSKGIAENDAKLQMDQEYDAFWNVALVPTVGLLIAGMFNNGRQVAFNKYSSDIFAYRYTAVLDSHTTDYCRSLDGLVFQMSDPNYALLTPPNHFGCRSFWTPILPSESDGVEVTGKPEDMPIYATPSTFKDGKYASLSEVSTLIKTEIQNEKKKEEIILGELSNEQKLISMIDKL